MEQESIKRYLRESTEMYSKIEMERVLGLAKKIKETNDSGNMTFIIGNGGSASAASHLACDLMKTVLNDYSSQKGRLKINSLVDNIATISAYANDLSYDEIFSQQLKNLAKKNDLLIAMTGSGNSKNIINAIKTTKKIGVYTFGLLGNDGGKTLPICDDYILIPSKNYGIVEDMHMVVGHLVTLLLKEKENFIY